MTVIPFPIRSVTFDFDDYREEPAVILILPTVRIERHTEEKVRASIGTLKRVLRGEAPDCVLITENDPAV